MTGSIQAIIFDLDGVLVDTEPLVVAAWQEVLAPHGLYLSEEDIQTIMGIDEETTNRYILEKTGLAMDLPSATHLVRKHLAALFKAELRPAEGAEELLQQSGGIRDRDAGRYGAEKLVPGVGDARVSRPG
jgi:beta-phosphoglucomutase-like phosphatase (HAD superfamily)